MLLMAGKSSASHTELAAGAVGLAHAVLHLAELAAHNILHLGQASGVGARCFDGGTSSLVGTRFHAVGRPLARLLAHHTALLVNCPQVNPHLLSGGGSVLQGMQLPRAAGPAPLAMVAPAVGISSFAFQVNGSASLILIVEAQLQALCARFVGGTNHPGTAADILVSRFHCCRARTRMPWSRVLQRACSSGSGRWT